MIPSTFHSFRELALMLKAGDPGARDIMEAQFGCHREALLAAGASVEAAVGFVEGMRQAVAMELAMEGGQRAG